MSERSSDIERLKILGVIGMDATSLRSTIGALITHPPLAHMRGCFALASVLALLIPLWSCGPQSPSAMNDHAPIIRVKIVPSATDHVTLIGQGETSVQVAGETQPHRLRFPENTPVMLTRGRDGWHVGNIVLGGPTGAAAPLAIQPERDGDISIDGKTYRGKYRFVPAEISPPTGNAALVSLGLLPGNSDPSSKFDVINDVNIDLYLQSVISGEMPRTFGEEALKAQAIVARTYALYESKTSGIGKDFDVYADTRSQVYPGMNSETDRSRQAADVTGGIVVAAGPAGQERIFKAYFSACCGGIGQSAADAFGDAPSRELAEVKVGSLCNESPRYNWAPIELSKPELTRRIRSWGAKRNRPERELAMLARIDIAGFNQFGRPVRFMLTDSAGRKYSLSGEETRWACNADANGGATLYSSFFNPVNTADSVRFSDGHGYGHGVGLCQWCAQARSEKGMRHEDIVLLSYPTAKLVRAY